MDKLMKQLGMKQKRVDAVRVIIETSDEKIVIEPAEVMLIEMRGNRSYQITGEERVETNVNDEDVELVMKETGVEREVAEEYLKRANGDIAEAIMLIQENEG